MSKSLVDGAHILPSGAELTIADGLPVSVLFHGADVEQTQEEIEAFADLWIQDMDDSDDDAPDPTKIWIDPDQPTHLYTDPKRGSRRVVLRNGIVLSNASNAGDTPCILAMDRREDWPPGVVDGKWYDTWNGDLIEGATLTPLESEVQA